MRLPETHRARFEGAFASQRVCVTGGAGFIGRFLVEALLAYGARVTVIDDLSSSDISPVATLLDASADQLRFVHASILEPTALEDAIAGSTLVFHLAATRWAQSSGEDPDRCVEVNVTGTVRVAEAARKLGAEQLIYVGSGSAYGDSPTPHVETMPPRPMTPCAASKVAGEFVIAAWDRCFGLPGVRLRLFDVVGPGRSAEHGPLGVVERFARALTSGGRPVIYGDGSQTRDFTPMADAVTGLLLAASCAAPLHGEVINIGSGRGVSIVDLATMMSRLAGREGVAPLYEPERPIEPRRAQADLTRAREVLGYRPTASLEVALAQTIECQADDARAAASGGH